MAKFEKSIPLEGGGQNLNIDPFKRGSPRPFLTPEANNINMENLLEHLEKYAKKKTE